MRHSSAGTGEGRRCPAFAEAGGVRAGHNCRDDPPGRIPGHGPQGTGGLARARSSTARSKPGRRHSSSCLPPPFTVPFAPCWIRNSRSRVTCDEIVQEVLSDFFLHLLAGRTPCPDAAALPQYLIRSAFNKVYDASRTSYSAAWQRSRGRERAAAGRSAGAGSVGRREQHVDFRDELEHDYPAGYRACATGSP